MMLYIAENLKSFRKEKDMTQETVAEILNVSPQSVSKWERGDTFPDITLLPALANLYKTSVDALIGMDKINDTEMKTLTFTMAHEHMRNKNYCKAVDVLSGALKTFPNDESLMAELAMSLALAKDSNKLAQAISLCERVLSGNQSEKIHHTTRAALSFIYLKSGEKEKAITVAKNLPHIRESRETILAEFDKEPSPDEIDAYLKFIALGEDPEQDVVEIDVGVGMVTIADALRKEIGILREEIQAPQNNDGYSKLPKIRLRDNPVLSSNQIRVRHYADYLLDETFIDPQIAVDEIVAILRQMAK